MATHSSILEWKIPWTEEPGGPQSMGSQKPTNYHCHHLTKDSEILDIYVICMEEDVFTLIKY